MIPLILDAPHLAGGVHVQFVGCILSVSDAPQGVDAAPRQSLQNCLSNQGCTFAERLSDLFAQNQILIVHGVKGDGSELAHIHLAVLTQHEFVGRHIDDPSHQAAGFLWNNMTYCSSPVFSYIVSAIM